MQDLINTVLIYFTALDWKYIFSLVILCSVVTHDNLIKGSGSINELLLKVPRSWRVIIVGILYGGLLFYFRDNHKKDLETYLHSLVFSMVFYELIFKWILKFLTREPQKWVENSRYYK